MRCKTATTLFVTTTLLTGCASTQDLLNRAPDESFQTTVKSETIRDCLISKDAGMFVVTPFRRGWLVAASGSGNGNNAVVNVLLTPVGEKTNVEVRHATSFKSDYTRNVDGCLKDLPKA